MAKKNTTTTVATETKVATETESVVPTAVVSNDDGVPEYKGPEGDLIHILMPIFAGLNPHWATVEALAALYERDKMKLDIFQSLLQKATCSSSSYQNCRNKLQSS